MYYKMRDNQFENEGVYQRTWRENMLERWREQREEETWCNYIYIKMYKNKKYLKN